jgi:hypothetical protein
MNMKKLNQSGFMHWTTTVLPLVVIAAVAVIGVKVLTASHALTPAVNGNLYTYTDATYTPTLTYVKSIYPGNGTTSNCRYWGATNAAASIDGKKMANTCQNTTSKTFEIDTYNRADATGFKKLAAIPTTVSSNKLKWQKTAVGTSNVQILDLERTTTTPFYGLFALYDSVTGTRKTVKVGGTDNFIPTSKGAVNFYDWSADGKKILYILSNETSSATTNTVKLTACSVDISLASPTNTCGAAVSVPGVQLWYVAWNRDSNKLAIVTNSTAQTKTSASSLYTANVDLSGLKKLTAVAAGNTLQFLVWSPDGLQIAMTNYQYTVTPTVQTEQIRNSSTGAIVRQKVESALIPVIAWLPQ